MRHRGIGAEREPESESQRAIEAKKEASLTFIAYLDIIVLQTIK